MSSKAPVLRSCNLHRKAPTRYRGWRSASPHCPLASHASSTASCQLSAASEGSFCEEQVGGIIWPSIFRQVAPAGGATIAGFTTAGFGDMALSRPGALQGAPYRHLAAALAARSGGSRFEWALPTLVHGSHVVAVDSPARYGACDGLVTTRANLVLGVTAADCGTVLLRDACGLAIGACHVGWRGAAAGIVPATVRAMRALGAAPEHLLAYVGPCISVDAFEAHPKPRPRP